MEMLGHNKLSQFCRGFFREKGNFPDYKEESSQKMRPYLPLGQTDDPSMGSPPFHTAFSSEGLLNPSLTTLSPHTSKTLLGIFQK